MAIVYVNRRPLWKRMKMTIPSFVTSCYSDFYVYFHRYKIYFQVNLAFLGVLLRTMLKTRIYIEMTEIERIKYEHESCHEKICAMG